MSVPVIRRATSEDADRIGSVGPAAYAAAYGELWDDGAALSRWLGSYGTAAVSDFLARDDTRIWVAEIDGEIVGFLTMIIGSANPATGETEGAELPRIYFLPGAQRLGLGRRLAEAAIAEARSLGLSHVWLDHMQSAEYAGRAYRKWGFAPLGVWRFDQPVRAGCDAMNGLILRL